MKIIGVDIGNSTTKLGTLDAQGNLVRCQIQNFNEDLLHHLSAKERYLWSICSVNKASTDRLTSWISSHRLNDKIQMIGSNHVPIESNVESRAQVGRDRLVAAWMAWKRYREPLIVIDAGTAVTVDHVDEMGVFQGGVIFPGAKASLLRLADSTHDLPNLLSASHRIEDIMDSVIGKNTETAILKGVYHAQLAAIITIANSIGRDNKVVATGGGIEFLKSFLPRDWDVDPLLVLSGAHSIGSAGMTAGLE